MSESADNASTHAIAEAIKVRGFPRGRKERYAATRVMIDWIVDERTREPTICYGELRRRAMAKFRVSHATAERGISAAASIIRERFDRFCADAPSIIFDAYMQLHGEHMARAVSSQREADRVMHLKNARHNLDSLRDMFGLRSAININISANAVSASAFGELTDTDLEVLARLDIPTNSHIIDVPNVETSINLANIAVDAAIDEVIKDEDEEEEDDE